MTPKETCTPIPGACEQATEGLCRYILENKDWEAEGYPGGQSLLRSPKRWARTVKIGARFTAGDVPDARETSTLQDWHSLESRVDWSLQSA